MGLDALLGLLSRLKVESSDGCGMISMVLCAKKKEAPENSHRLISGTSSDSRYKRLKSFLFEFFKI